MRSDDKSAPDKQAPDALRKDDISADDLLRLLHESVGDRKDTTKPDKSRSRKRFEETPSLEIDESIYKSAERELHDNEALTSTDDDFDIDELINKYINRSEKPNKSEGARVDSIVRQLDPRERASAKAETDADDKAAIGFESITERTKSDKTYGTEKSSVLDETSVSDETSVPDETDDSTETDDSDVRLYRADDLSESESSRRRAPDTLEQALLDANRLFDEEAELEAAEKDKSKDEIEYAPTRSDSAKPIKPKSSVFKSASEKSKSTRSALTDPTPGEEAASEAVETGAGAKKSGTVGTNLNESDISASRADTGRHSAKSTPQISELPDTQRTAVFDIKEVRSAASDVVDEPVDGESAPTEVFDKVSDGSAGELPDPTKTYGDPDAEEIDQTDLNLMIAFGMNDEIKDKVGEEKANEIEVDIKKHGEETEQLMNVAKKYEYTSRSQNVEILTKYKSQYYTLIIRIIAAVLLLGAMFLLENCSMFDLELPSFMNPQAYPVVYAMIDLQFVVLCGALVFRQLPTGLKNLFTLKPTAESITAFVLILSVAYTIFTCAIAPRGGFELYNLPVAVAVLFALLYEFMNTKRDVFSFNVISTKRRKFVVSPVSDETESLEREIFKDYVPSDSQIIRVSKTDFVDGFFERTEDNVVSRPIIGIVIPLVMILGAGFFILNFMKSQSLYDSVTMAYISMALTMPLSAFMIYSYPSYRASRKAYDSDSTIIGEVSLNEYASSSVISFEDKEVFPSGGVKVTSIKVYGQNRIDEIIYNLASAFIKVGGPLADVFSQATHDLGHSDNVVLEEVDEDGFTVTVDEILVNIGKAAYMEKQDYEPPYDAEDKKIEESSVGIMYIAYQGQLAAKVYVQYTIDNEFEQILAQLYKTGMCVGIKSFDPNIDDVLLSKKIKSMKYPVKVIRSRTVEDIPHTFERCSSGIVSKRSVKDLLKTVALCEKVNSAIKSALIVKILAMLLGIVASIVIYTFGSELGITSLHLAVYQLIFTILVLGISRLIV